jgi:chaperonin GroES
MPALIATELPGRMHRTTFITRSYSMSFRPLQDRVLIRGVEQDAKTAGGILIPDTAKQKPTEGDVIAVGPGARSEDGKVQALDVRVGDRVLYGKWTGTEIKVDGDDFVIMKEADILGIVRAAAATRKTA